MTPNQKLDPIHPGEFIREEVMKPWNMSVEEFAKALSLPSNRLQAILDGQAPISAEIALRLSRYFGTTVQYWINMQNHYDLSIARAQWESRIISEVQPRSSLAQPQIPEA